MSEVDECDTCGYESCECCGTCNTYPCECCGDCGEYPCECCSECGYVDCECCSTCEKSPDYCNCCPDCNNTENNCTCHGHGTSESAPWVRRGIKVDVAPGCSSGWKSVWPEIDSGIDPVMAAADFYLLEAVGNRALYTYTTPTMEMLSPEQENEMFEMLGVKGRTSRELILKDMKSQLKTLRSEDKTYALRDIENKALAFQAELVDILDRSFVPYVHIAIGGEIRHHRAMGDHLSNDRNEAWSDWRTIFDTIGNDSLLDVEQLFLEFGEDNTYGGPNWAAVTKILWLRHQEMLGPDLYTNKKLFVDRVFSLQHNGGSLFDKITWSVKNMRGWGVGKLSHLLDYHSAEIPNIVGLLRLASPKVRALLLEYVEAAQGVEPTHERFKTDTLSRELAISPILQCQDCKMDIARGHVLECGNFLKPNAPLEYTLGRNMKTLWQDDISAKELAFISSPMIVPFDAWGNPQIEPTQEFIVEIEGTITEYGGKVVETFYSRKHTALEIFEGITFATLPSATDIIVAHNGDRSNLPCISTTHLRICITQEDIKSPLYYRQTYTRAPIKSGPNGEVILLATTFNAAVKRPYK